MNAAALSVPELLISQVRNINGLSVRTDCLTLAGSTDFRVAHYSSVAESQILSLFQGV
jgi:hypothetical protein